MTKDIVAFENDIMRLQAKVDLPRTDSKTHGRLLPLASNTMMHMLHCTIRSIADSGGA